MKGGHREPGLGGVAARDLPAHAINHWDLAVATHGLNLPWVQVHREDITNAPGPHRDAFFFVRRPCDAHLPHMCGIFALFTHEIRERLDNAGAPWDSNFRQHA